MKIMYVYHQLVYFSCFVFCFELYWCNCHNNSIYLSTDTTDVEAAVCVFQHHHCLLKLCLFSTFVCFRLSCETLQWLFLLKIFIEIFSKASFYVLLNSEILQTLSELFDFCLYDMISIVYVIWYHVFYHTYFF